MCCRSTRSSGWRCCKVRNSKFEVRSFLWPLLYVYRVLLTGIHLICTGVVNANLVELNAEARLPYIADLIARKQSGENTTLEDADVAFHQREYERLRVELQAAHDGSQLPELPSDETRKALNDLLVRVRLRTK